MGKISDALEKSKKESTEAEKENQAETLDFRKNNKRVFSPKSLLKTDRPAKKIAPSLVTLTQPYSFEAEQFKALKTNLLFSSDRKPPRTIMVTSAFPDEGKSFVAANLAVSYAQSVDEHVLLIDCDLRLSTVHRVFDIRDDSPGLSDVLAGKIEIPAALYKTDIEKLRVMPGGKAPSNPTELLSSARMKNLLKEVESRYDDRYIFVDSPPPLIAAETIAISRQVDGIIIVVRHESTPRKELKELIDLMEKDKIIGIIVNRYDLRLAKYYGYGKYSSYYVKK